MLITAHIIFLYICTKMNLLMIINAFLLSVRICQNNETCVNTKSNDGANSGQIYTDVYKVAFIQTI